MYHTCAATATQGALAGLAHSGLVLVSHELHKPGGQPEEVQERATLQVCDVQPQGGLVPYDGDQAIERPTEQLRSIGLDAAQQSQPSIHIDAEISGYRRITEGTHSCMQSAVQGHRLPPQKQQPIEVPTRSIPGQQLSVRCR